jgi:CubicO group peptidase (beta-lactamase class C family)
MIITRPAPSHVTPHRPTFKQAFKLTIVTLALTLGATSFAQNTASPESVGLSSQRLTRIDDLMAEYMDNQHISGAITSVARHGETVHFSAQGYMDRENEIAMRADAIFRMASMSKPVTGVAILMMLEEGKLRLEDPVSKFIPEFANTTVAMLTDPNAVPSRDPDIYRTPADREITIRDLLTHTSGLASSGISSRTVANIAPRNTSSDLATYIPTLGAVPLDFQPGARWQYSLLAGIETLGRIVEITSGLSFDQFLQQRLFGPLQMSDTSFVVPTDKLPRVVTLYTRTDEGQLEREDTTPTWLDSTTLFSGGGGLYSTTHDYMRFAQMLLNRGELDGARILGTRTVELMASNHIGELYGPASGRAEGLGFGLTVEVVLDPVLANTRRGKGSFSWGGAFGTYFWVDPYNDLVAVMMIQTPNGDLRKDFVNAVIQAIVED